MMVIKWMDKIPVSISTFHSDTMVIVCKREREISKPRGIKKYNLYMGGVDMKDHKLQPYAL
jgi:hypothetical protein